MENKITIQLLKKLSSLHNFEEGEYYFEEGEVLGVTKTDNSYSAEVFGNFKYDVEIKLNKKKEWEFSCTCPYNLGGICKHCVALGLAVVNGNIDLDLSIKSNPKLQKKKDKSNKIKELLKSATDFQKEEFLNQILKELPAYSSKFEVFLKNDSSTKAEINMDETVESVLESLNEIDFSYDNLMDHLEHANYYRDDWEVMYEAGQEILHEAIEYEIRECKRYIQQGLRFEALKIVIAIYEAIILFDETKIEDEYDVMDSFEYELLGIWKPIYTEVENQFISGKTSNEFIEIVLLFFNNRFSKPELAEHMPISYFDTLLNEWATAENEQIFKKYIFSIFDEIVIINLKLKIIKDKGDSKKWVKLSKKYFKKDFAVAEGLLKYYEIEDNRKEYKKIAVEIFNIWPHYLAEQIHNYLNYSDNQELYLKLLELLTKEKEDISYFAELYNLETKENINSFIDDIREFDDFYIEVLIYIKDFEKIKKFFDNNFDNHEIGYFTKPIINIYPKHCFEKLKNFSEVYLTKYVGRKHYRFIAKKLMYLKQIKDPEIQEEVQLFFRELIKKYYRRPALKNEFQLFGIK